MLNKWSLLAALALLLVVSAMQANAASVTVCFKAPNSREYKPAGSIRCTDSGSAVHEPSSVNSCAQFTSLADGLYNCSVNLQPWYPVWRTIQLGSTPVTINLPPVLPRYGLTVVRGDSPDYSFYTTLNMTLPTGDYDVDMVSMAQQGQGAPEMAQYHYGTTGIPSRVYTSSLEMNLVMASAGTYRLAAELHDSTSTTTNFTSASAHTFVFFGANRESGFVGWWRSDSEDARTWHVGNAIVTNPSADCASYSWNVVNAYSWNFGDVSATGTPFKTLGEECFTPPTGNCLVPVYPSDAPTRTCGVFGDPHIVLFNSTGVTCGHATAFTLVDNSYLTLSAVAAIVDTPSGATAMTNITFEYKASCNPFVATINAVGGDLISVNAPLAGRHTVRIEGNNAYIDAIRMRLQIRHVQASGMATLIFGISIPEALAAVSTGICRESCPGYEIPTGGVKRGTAKYAAAMAACDGIDDTFAHDSCLFDVATTGDENFAQAASESVVLMREVSEAWAEGPHAPYEMPPLPSPQAGTPSPGSSSPGTGSPAPGVAPGSGTPAPTQSSPPSGSASTLVMSAVLVAAALLAVLM